MTLLNPTPTNHHSEVYAASSAVLKQACKELNIGATIDTPTGKHYTDITFSVSLAEAIEPTLATLKSALEPLNYKAFRTGIGGSVIRVLHPRPNWMVVIGYQGNKRGYINVPEDEARRRWLEKENEGAPEDCIKTEVDEPVGTVWFHDELEIY